jgi:hypothetical protein
LQRAERAHVDLDFIGNGNAYTIMIANYGESIANIVEYSFSHGIYPFSEKDLSIEKATTIHQDFMPMNQILPPTNGETKEFWSFDFKDLFAMGGGQGSNKTIVRGTVAYFDIFGGEHETEVVYESWGPTLKNLPEHNRYT